MAATVAVRFVVTALFPDAAVLLVAPTASTTAAQLQIGHLVMSCRCAGQCSRPK